MHSPPVVPHPMTPFTEAIERLVARDSAPTARDVRRVIRETARAEGMPVIIEGVVLFDPVRIEGWSFDARAWLARHVSKRR